MDTFANVFILILYYYFLKFFPNLMVKYQMAIIHFLAFEFLVINNGG